MVLRVLKMNISSFKGISNAEYSFPENNVKIFGKNGAGKTTLADAFFWVFADSNYALAKNPDIIPMGSEESNPKVEITLSLDGKETIVSKSQKFKTKTDDNGKVTSSITNHYTINGVDKSSRDFNSDLIERGIDMDNFTTLTHPFAFTADTSKKGREQMRKMLFEMITDVSDAEIAKNANVPDVTAALDKGYRIDEIESTNKSTLKSISEKYGKDNSIINAKIDGLLEGKTGVNISELTNKKIMLESQMANIRDEIEDLLSGSDKLNMTIEKLERERAEIVETLTKSHKHRADDLTLVKRERETDLIGISARSNTIARDITNTKRQIENAQDTISNYRVLYGKVQDERIKESDLKCPTCGREYPAEEIEIIKKRHELSKTERMKDYKAKAEELKAQIVELNGAIDQYTAALRELEEQSNAAKREIESCDAQLSMMPESPDIEGNPKIIEIDERLESLRRSIAEPDDSIQKREIAELEEKLATVVKQLNIASHDEDIDKRIQELRDERANAEINRANAEKILDEVERFKRIKNDLLSDKINSHFKIAEFRLFKTLKNGTIEESCDLLIDGKEINTQANQSLQVLARIDVINGLQEYFNKHYPVWVDDYALFTSESDARLKLDTQVIKLIAFDGVDKAEVEND